MQIPPHKFKRKFIVPYQGHKIIIKILAYRKIDDGFANFCIGDVIRNLGKKKLKSDMEVIVPTLYGINVQRRTSRWSPVHRYGAALVHPESLDIQGYGFIHLSKTIDSELAQQLSASVARYFMKAKDYYDLKAFSYFPTKFTFSDFLAVAQRCNPDDLPFEIDSSSTFPALVVHSGDGFYKDQNALTNAVI